MRNFFVSYDLNGKAPTHAQMDAHLKKLGGVARVLETVWYVSRASSLDALYNYANLILSTNDRIIIIEANNAMMRNLLIPSPAVQKAWAA